MSEQEQTAGGTPADETPATTDGLTPNDPSQTGSDAELTDEQKAQAAAESTQGDQGPEVREQDAAPTGSPGFDPNRPVADSPPPPEAQSGVPTGPTLPENEGVEPQPQYAGDVPASPAQPEGEEPQE